MTNAPGWITLTEGEEVIWSDHPSLVPYVMAAAGSILLVGLGIAIVLFGQGVVDFGYDVPGIVPLRIIGGLIALVGLVGLLGELVSWWSRRYVVTTEEVYRKHGIVSRKVTNLNHTQVQNTTFTQSIPGRLLSYGHVKIDTAGGEGAEVVFKNVDNPDDVVGRITRHLGGSTGN